MTEITAIGGQYVINDNEITITATASNAMFVLNNVNQKTNFTVEFELFLSAMGNNSIGLVYRTTQFAEQGYAYLIGLNGTLVLFGRQDNLGAASNNTWVNIGSYGHWLGAGVWLKFKVIVSADSHSVYVNDVLKIAKRDSVFLGAGKFGIQCSGAGYQHKIRNLKIT